jgi:hypothetical protein
MTKLHAYLLSTVAPAVIAAASMVTTSPALAQPGVPPECTGPGTKTSEGNTPQTKCLAAIQIPGNPLRSFDISWVARDIEPGWYMLADRSNAGIDLINADNLTVIGTYSAAAPGAPAAKFTGTVCTAGGVVVPCSTTVAVNNNISGPDGVTSHGIWVYAGDGDSTLKVIDLRQFPPKGIVQSVSTGGTTRVDEMALNLDGTLLLAANNAEDPPFATLFHANGDSLGQSNVSKITKVEVSPTIIPSGFGLSLEQPTWEPSTQRFWTSIPVIANDIFGCNHGQNPGPITCDGGLLVFDPNNLTSSQCGPGSALPNLCVLGAFNPATNTGVLFLRPANPNIGGSGCGPNGVTVSTNPNGSHNLLLGCTPGNNPFDATTQVINPARQGLINLFPTLATTFADIVDITGSDEVWFNPSIYAPSRFIGDNRYYLGASKSYTTTPVCTPSVVPTAPKFCAVLGVVGSDSLLIETIPQSSNSHSVAADAARNLVYVPQVAPASVVGPGGDTTTVGQQLCGGTDGCVVVYGVGTGGHPPAD